jgi:colanic acid biosynthesis glycosyl transferase WcaI
MHVLVIAQFFPPEVGGVSTRAYNAVKGLLEVGHTVTVISGKPRFHPNIKDKYVYTLNEKYFNKIRVKRVWVPFSHSIGFIRRFFLFASFMFSSLSLLGHVKDVQVIWIANPNFFSLFPGYLYSLFNHCPLVRNVDDLWPESAYDFGFIKHRILRRFIDLVSGVSYILPDAITVISPSYKEIIFKKYGVKKDKIFTVEVGVDVDVFHPICFENKKEKFKVMYSGNLGLAYDFETLIQAGLLLSKYDDINIIIRGKGELSEFLEKKINNMSLKNIILDTEQVQRNELCKILNCANVFVLPHKNIWSAEKGLPTKIYEYQACGKPIICSSQDAPAKYIRSTKSGIIIPTEDPEAMSKAILNLYYNNTKRKRLGKNGWIYVSNNLATNKIGEKLSDVFYNVI